MTERRKKAVVVGASSGIGRALAKVLGNNGYEVGLVARRLELLHQLQKEIPAQTYIKKIDLNCAEEAIGCLSELIKEMKGMDLIIINSGVNTHNIELDWNKEMNTIGVNVSGFCAMANVALKYFLKQNSGHIVGISSIAGLRGSATSPSYSASKAFVSNYLEGLRHRLSGKDIYVTDIRPGLVDTDMIRGQSRLFWVATPDKAAEQIFSKIKKRCKVAYVTKRWVLIAWVLNLIPDWLYSWRYRDEF
ncbi:MAG: SDR family NAD(P)-dependent oxidoreductase [Candidatus Omnitrophica bacterium]|nr:SDR family NAD(P)-dependent oxidoreductase [Candidatus Omnitrophota bacterium]